MYDNIGGKIKILAKSGFIVEAIAAVITGIVLWVEFENPWFSLIILGGPIVAWVSSWLLYGFGEIIDMLCSIERNTRKDTKKSAAEVKSEEERVTKLKKLREQGLITEKEYQKAIFENQ